jgi:hypothetical protein
MAEALRAEEDAHRAEEKMRRDSAPSPKPTRKAVPGQVYLIRDHAGYFKIGISTKWAHERAFGISIALPFPVTVLALGTFQDARAKELEFHERFAAKRLNGEWFALEPDDVTEITARLKASA